MEQQHEWIDQEKRYFGQQGHKYDFENFNSKEESKKLEKLRTFVDEGKQRVNFKVEELFVDQNQRYDKLIRDRDTIVENKRQLEETIEFTNKKKNDELDSVWTQVS